MVVVSEFFVTLMINYKLDQQLYTEKIIQDINKLISSHGNNLQDKILHISIRTITHNDTTMIPKLVLKE